MFDSDRNIDVVARGYGFGEFAELSFTVARDDEPVLGAELMTLQGEAFVGLDL